MSFAFVGRVYSSIKGFYNEINSATLTGAIDVVIVKQEDGSYHSSPFHVRFGKLGVLRAREKIVDIEINGQPVGLHMKLGEAGEAFFVLEVPEDEEEIEFPAYLATSPIESSDELMSEGVVELKAQHGQQFLQEKLQQRADQQQQEEEEQQQQAEESASLTLQLSSLTKDVKSDSSVEEDKRKGKPRRKVLKKKKQKHGGARSSPRSQSMPEGLGLVDQDHIFEMEVTESTSDDEEVIAYSLGASRSTSLDMKKVGMDAVMEELELPLRERRMNSMEYMVPFSEPELSPVQSPLPSRPPSPKSDTELERQHTEEKQQQLLQDSSATWDWGEFPKQAPLNSSELAPSKELIDSVLERQDSEKVSSGGLLSLWSKQKTTVSAAAKKEATVEEKGMYLDDLATLEDPEIAKLYLGSPRFQSIREREREDDSESGRGASLPQSPHSVDGAIGGPVSFLESEVRHLGVVSLSLCGGLADPDGITLDKFMKKVITFDDLADQPGLLSNPDLVVKIRDGYFNWATAAPMVLCEMAFNKPLPETKVSSLVQKHMPKKTMKKKGSWWSWRSSTNQNADSASDEVSHPTTSAQMTSAIPVVRTTLSSDNEATSSKVSEASLSPLVSPATSPPTSAHGTPRKIKAHRTKDVEQPGTETDTDNSEKETQATARLSPSPPISLPSSPPSQALPCPPSSPVAPPSPSLSPLPPSPPTPPSLPRSSDSTSTPTPTPTPSQPVEVAAGRAEVTEVKLNAGKTRDKYIKTLRLTSEQVAQLNLREGQNEITFSVTTQYQGTTRCMSHIYLWNYDDKIVISDIDGTITKSDVMGQILPLIGRDWSQSGVAELFTRLSNNGYKLLYLSARAIGQSRVTKELLKNIRQGDLVLPNGPLLLNPTSLLRALHREVIVKNPEEFKIHCLKDIATLFPSTPFYAGFGNKINDVIAYRALDIPSFRIFTINPQGQLRHDLSHTFLSSYSKMSDIADHFFPPINFTNRSMSNAYSNVNYWRNPPADIDQQDLALLTTVCETSKAAAAAAITTVATSATATTTTTTTTASTSAPKMVVEESAKSLS